MKSDVLIASTKYEEPDIDSNLTNIEKGQRDYREKGHRNLCSSRVTMPVAPAKIHEIQGPPNTEPKSSSTSPTNIEKGERTFKSRVAPAEIQETDCPSNTEVKSSSTSTPQILACGSTCCNGMILGNTLCDRQTYHEEIAHLI